MKKGLFYTLCMEYFWKYQDNIKKSHRGKQSMKSYNNNRYSTKKNCYITNELKKYIEQQQNTIRLKNNNTATTILFCFRVVLVSALN